MDIIFEDPPCKIDDVINLSYSFDNLHKFLNFLLLNEKESFSKIRDIRLKLTEIDDIKVNLEEVSLKVTNFESRFSQIDGTINSFFQKFNELDNKIVGAVHKINIFTEDIKGFNTKLVLHEENINNLNRLTEENIKTLFKQNETLEKIRNTNELLLEKADKHDKSILKINNELLRFNDVEKTIRENTSKIEENTKSIQEYHYYTNKKFSDVDTSILNMIDTMNEVNRQLEKKGSLNVNMNNLMNSSQNSQETTNTQMMNEIAKGNKEIENFKKLFREFNEKMDKLSKSNLNLEEQIKEAKNIKSESKFSNENNSNPTEKKTSKNVFENIDNYPEENSQNREDFHMETDSIKQNIEMLFERIKKIQEAFKSITTSVMQKTDKSEFEKLNRALGQEVEKLNNKINDMNKSIDIKVKNVTQTGGGVTTLATNSSSLGKELNREEGEKLKHGNTINVSNSQNIEGFEFDQGIVNMTKQLIQRELQGREEMVKIADFIEEYKTKSDTNKSEIDKIFESIVEIRRTMVECPNIEEKFSDLNQRLSDVDHTVKKQRNHFEERFKNLEGDATVEEGPTENPNGGSIKDNIKNLNNQVKILNEKVDKVTMRQDNMNNEILTKVKKDLSQESGKILTEFRGDLKISITKIEEQLREKVDRFSLDEFGRRVDDKLSNEINKKLDRTDLKKNNNMINKKIDTLENKISKTLVDTLIDLQMEEAPLIVKKSYGGNGGEKCASCNQLVFNNTVINEEQCNNNHSQGKFKFKNVQENCYKFGAGSYSRYLSSIDNVNEDLKYKSLQLPDIVNNKTSRKFNYIQESKLKNKILEEFAEKNLNSMLNEEFEKKMVNPENLIKTANKLYETVEKEKRNIMNNTNINK